MNVPITVNATDDVQVVAANLLVNGQIVSTDTSPPYQFSYLVPTNISGLTLSANATDLGGNTGSASDKPLNFPKDFTAAQQYDFTKLREILNGAALASKFVPGCTAGEPPAITGAISIAATKSCCENEKRITNATELSGAVGLKIPAFQCRLPAFSFGIATLTANVGLEATGTVTGSGIKDDCASTCGWKLDGQVSASLSGAIGVNVVSPDVIEVTGGIRGGGTFTVSGSCGDVSVSGCVGPPNVFGTVTLGAWITKEVSTDAFQSFMACYP